MNMRKIISLLLALLFVASCQKTGSCPNPPKKANNTFKVEFKATPQQFSAQGGQGTVSGVLKEFSPEGQIISEKTLEKGDFTLKLKSGDASLITIDDVTKSFVISQGIEEAKFVLLAIAKVRDTETLTQELTIIREKGEVPKLKVKSPLEYVAEYNVNPDGTGFVTTYATDVSGYFSFEDAVAKFSDITIDGNKYHLPSQEEWLAIVPIFNKKAPDYVAFNQPSSFKDVSETVIVSGDTVSSLNDYLSTGKNITYALRFKNTKFISAWKYEYIAEPNRCGLLITCRLLENMTSTLTVEDLQKDSFWTEKDITRWFPASGYIASEKLYLRDSYGYFWSSSAVKDTTFAWGMYFFSELARVGYNLDFVCRTIRLFTTE